MMPAPAVTNAALLGVLRAKYLADQEPERPAWSATARPEQLEPDGDWRTWLILAGRGFGKTRTGAETVNGWARSGRARRIAVIAQTAADVRDISIAALRKAAPDAAYSPSKHHLLTWPNGATAMGFSAEEPDSLRGYQFDSAWCDELAAWRYPETWDQLQFALRIGQTRQIVTTTPRPTRIIRDLLDSPSVSVTRGRTLDNAANLSPEFLRDIVARYEGTRLGRQELDAEVLLDVPGALWTWETIERNRRTEAPHLVRVVVAIDPAASSDEEADETAVAVAGLGEDGHYYVLAVDGYHLTPHGWASRAIDAYDAHRADALIAETNNGGEMVVATLKSVRASLPVRTVTATRGKALRAEPVAALYEQGRVHHVGRLERAEEQMTAFPVASEHDDRVDALVYALSALLPATDNPWAALAGRNAGGVS